MTDHRTHAARTIHRVGLAFLVALLALLAPAPSAPAATTPSAEDEVASAIDVVIDRMSPAIPQPGDVLRISGRLVSNARSTITDVSVQLRRSSSAVANRESIRAIAEAGLAGDEPADVPLTGTRALASAALAPGARQPFSIRVAVDDLGLPGPGTYALGIDAYGIQEGVQTLDTRQGAVHTFVPWFPPGTDITPIGLVWLWPLADWPARGPDGVLLTDQTPRALAEGGRLSTLLEVGARFPGVVSWLADPALLETAAEMSDGYQVLRGSEVLVGDREEAAGRWLQGLRQATRGQGLRVLPYADVDASALTRGGLANDVVRAVTQGPGIADAALGRGTPALGDLYWAPFGRIDRPTLNVLASAGVTTVVLSAEAMPPTDEATVADGLATAALPTSVGTIRAVLTDPTLTTLLSPVSAADAVLARQRFLAETAVLAQGPQGPQGDRSLVVAPSSVRWAMSPEVVAPLLRATRSAPWLSSLSLDALLGQPVPSTSRQRGGYGERAREAEITEDVVARIARTSADLEVFASVVDNPTGLVQPFSEALLRTESSGWRTEPAVGAALLADTSAAIADETGRVRVLSEGQVTLSGDTGTVPITIQNDLDRSVTVGLTLRGRPPLRLSAETVTGIRIEPGRFASVEVDARVVGGDQLPVDVQLLTPEGDDYGSPGRIVVSSTAYARAAAWVVAVAFLAIAVFVVVGVTRRIRTAHARRGSGLGR